MYQHLPLQDPPKFTQIGIFGWKICRLATLLWSCICKQRLMNRPSNLHFAAFGFDSRRKVAVMCLLKGNTQKLCLVSGSN
jgi:hypothetical protein